jgi:hypothetical protein
VLLTLEWRLTYARGHGVIRVLRFYRVA